ncbi:hypothetical protein [Sorangium sp. So ce388]|uniref:hypothetical protein n=1 Tax=Sorangium sp. So ce388 TaxID=3133309 RepID=UPI003F5AFF74
MTPARPAIPQLHGGPNPGQPVPRDPVNGVDLQCYARITAELAHGTASRAAVLARAGLDEARWLLIEQAWLLRLATAALQGDFSLASEHDAVLAAVQATLAEDAPPLPLDSYARIVAAIEGGGEPSRVLAEAGVRSAVFARSQRAWAAKLASDKALAAAFRDSVKRLRAGRGERQAP